jgi:nucleotide-binding universal stress UspA family protein
MRNIMLLAHRDRGQDARVRVAVDLVRALNGHLTCLDIAIIPESVADYATVGGEALLLADEERSEGFNRADLKAWLNREAVPFDWQDWTGELEPSIRHAAALADLIVVNRRLDTARYPDMLDLAGRLIVDDALPVVAVPQDARKFRATGNALIGWDGSPCAVAALRAAVPLLALAGSVTLLYVDDGSIKVPMDAAARYLAWHGITATMREERILTDPAGTVLLAEAASGHADYLVMGGFGHSRLAEAVFGGVTREMLTHCPIPLFLAHRG